MKRKADLSRQRIKALKRRIEALECSLESAWFALTEERTTFFKTQQRVKELESLFVPSAYEG